MAGLPKVKAPAQDEIEVTLFGPGYGECVLVHFGNNNWLTVDSCIDPDSKTPQALTYLKDIGVDPSVNVKMVIATHWHDDHVRGISKIFQACQNARFICSDALSCDEFQALVYSASHSLTQVSGVDEFGSIMDELERRAMSKPDQYIPPEFAVANQRIYMDSQCEIFSLSPSPMSIMMSRRSIASLLPKKPLMPKGSYVPFTDNRASVVLHISTLGHNILLGGDLEEEGDIRTGWSAIIASTTRPQTKASIFKIPHHGSEGAQHPYIRSVLLDGSPIALLTPFSAGNVSLPTRLSVERMCSEVDEVYTTDNSGRVGRIKRSTTVEKTIKDSFKSNQKVFTSKGHIRVRALPNSSWQVELFGTAESLCGVQHH